MAITIALAGNPNSGKTTMFNDLTGSNQYVGNWPGVTVEKKEGRLKGAEDVIIQGPAGIYSSPPTPWRRWWPEAIWSTSGPTPILNIVDAANIERNLY
jgi:ferrous iron transport protein B